MEEPDIRSQKLDNQVRIVPSKGGTQENLRRTSRESQEDLRRTSGGSQEDLRRTSGSMELFRGAGATVESNLLLHGRVEAFWRLLVVLHLCMLTCIETDVC